MAEIKDVPTLLRHFGEPSTLAKNKVIDHIDPHARAFIERSPFLLLSTSSADGWPDASPRGDPPGFAVVDSPKTLLIPDRPGNNRCDSFHNVLSNPRVGLLFLVPGQQHALRINGTARLLDDDVLCQRLSMHGKPARAVLEVKPVEVFFHCGKSLIRSRLWQPDHWPDRANLAGLGEALADQIGTIGRAEAEALVAESIEKRLY